MTMGLQDLMMFRDNLQQPEPTGMDNLRNLQALTMQGMAAENYMNEPNPMMNTGLMSLPVAQAGFGGFIKKITRIPRTIAKTVKRVAKSPIGAVALGIAAPYALPAMFPALAGSPILTSFLAGTGTSLLGGAKPGDAIKRGGLAALTTGVTRGLTTPKSGVTSSMATGPDPNMANYTGNVPLSSLEAPPAETSLFKDLFRSATDKNYDPEGTGLGRVLDRFSGKGQFEGLGLGERLGLPSSTPEIDYTTGKDLNVQKYVESRQLPDKILGSQTLGNVVDKAKGLIPKSTVGKIAAGAGVLSGVAALQGQEQIPQDQLAMAGLTPVETDFDKQQFTYRDRQGNILTRDEALALIQQASQNVGAGGQKVASGVTYGFDRVDDPVLSASGGLIGMAYGGQMPMNNMDIKYKVFSGMVGGRGDGMEDNVYMPIVERDNGQQVATLAVSPKEYVVDANTMSLLGNGNPDEGAEIMDQTVKDIRMAATGQKKQQKEIDGLAALNRMRRSV